MSVVPNTLGGFAGDPIEAAAAVTEPAPAADPTGVIDRLNSLLRGEISAAETYRNVVGHLADGHAPDRLAQLTAMQAEHGQSCGLLRQRIVDLGGTPADGSGVWGVWAQTVQGALSLLGGDVGGLRALREGEEHGLADYQAALNAVDTTTAQLIQNQLMPGQERHLAALDRMLSTVADR